MFKSLRRRGNYPGDSYYKLLDTDFDIDVRLPNALFIDEGKWHPRYDNLSIILGYRMAKVLAVALVYEHKNLPVAQNLAPHYINELRAGAYHHLCELLYMSKADLRYVRNTYPGFPFPSCITNKIKQQAWINNLH